MKCSASIIIGGRVVQQLFEQEAEKFKIIHQSAPTQAPRYRVGVPCASTTGQFPHGRDSTRYWKAFREK